MTQAFNAQVPPLETPRLILREYRRDDFDVFAAHLADPQSVVHLGVADRPNAWRYFCSHMGMWPLYGAGWWAMELRETGQMVGSIGAFYREGAGSLEVGWNTWREFWGRGYAGEAAAAVVDYAFNVRQEPTIHAFISAGNTSSIRVAERLGLVYERDTELHGKPVGIYVGER